METFIKGNWLLAYGLHCISLHEIMAVFNFLEQLIKIPEISWGISAGVDEY